ncbi:MAG: hypothetical protein IH999_04665 [Proteobacteria bacterium]|nr:hypothetical protein [Pseudomonadota bacterium]
MKCLRFLAIFLMGLGTAALASPNAALAEQARPGEKCQVDPLPEWSEPEHWAWSEICEGREADFNQLYGVWLDPKEADGWNDDRKLSQAFLETILLHKPFRGALTRKGVRIIGAWFRQPVDLGHGILDRELWLDKSRFESNVQLTSVKSADLISLEGSKFADSLVMAWLEVGGSLLMDDAEFGEVSLAGAKIGGQISMIDSKFTGELVMDSLEVGSSLFMRGAEFAEPVNLIFASIGSNLDLSGAKLESLDLTGTQITGELRLGSGQHPKLEWGETPRLILRNTVVEALQDREESWPENLQLELDGFTYSRLGGFGAEAGRDMASRDAQWFIKDWLAKDETYSPQPYQQLASVLRVAGHAEKADDILYASKERERSNAKGIRLAGLTLLKVVIGYGYGYRYFYSLAWMAVLVLVGVGVLRLADEQKKQQIADEQKNQKIPVGFWYSLDMALPIIRLREAHYEEVDLVSRPARIYFYAHKTLGYLLLFFFIAGLSGLTK